MPTAEIASKQAVYTLGLLHAELAGKLLANKREAIRLRTAMMQVGEDATARIQRRQHRREAPQQEQSLVQARDAL
jgi:hypothetical protein